MSLLCELSGESLSTTTAEDVVVVTPSGHVCRKKLLLAKLSETAGMDPFEPERPLTEDQLVPLVQFKKSSASSPLPRKSATSFTATLSLLQSEYEALVLELFDTRQALESTRRELSQALYQNDAAVRVVARLASERDAARQQLQDFKVNGVVVVAGSGDSASSNNKKRKLKDDEKKLPLENAIPDSHLQQMISTWESLHSGRKAAQKKAAESAPKPDQLTKFVCQQEPAAWHKTTCKGIVAMAGDDDNNKLLLTAGSDKQVIVYNQEKAVVQASWSMTTVVASVDLVGALAAVGLTNGLVHLYKLGSGEEEEAFMEMGSFDGRNGADSKDEESQIVGLRIHPDARHVVVAMQQSKIAIGGMLDDDKVGLISIFSQKPDDSAMIISPYTCGALHPDGLIFVVGTAGGNLLIWDLKSQTLAGTLVVSDAAAAVVAVTVSNNGYHIGAAYASGAVCVWDLRKQKKLAELNKEEKRMDSVTSVAFDASGKYLAFAGSDSEEKGAIHITTMKEWKITAALQSTTKQELNSVLWSSGGSIAAASNKLRQVQTFSEKKS